MFHVSIGFQQMEPYAVLGMDSNTGFGGLINGQAADNENLFITRDKRSMKHSHRAAWRDYENLSWWWTRWRYQWKGMYWAAH